MILNPHFELWDNFYSPPWNNLDFSYILESTLIYIFAFCSRKVNDWMIFCNKKNMHPFESFQGLFVNCTTLDRWDRKIESPSDRNFIKYRNFRNTIFPYLFSNLLYSKNSAYHSQHKKEIPCTNDISIPLLRESWRDKNSSSRLYVTTWSNGTRHLVKIEYLSLRRDDPPLSLRDGRPPRLFSSTFHAR